MLIPTGDGKAASKRAQQAAAGIHYTGPGTSPRNQPNARPAWLDLAHKALDAAVAAAYGWADYTPAMPDDEILRRLLALNLERAQA